MRDALKAYLGMDGSQPGLYNDTFRLIYHDCNVCGGRVVDHGEIKDDDESTTSVRTPYYTYRTEMNWFAGKRFHYYILYDQLKVYTDGNPTHAPTWSPDMTMTPEEGATPEPSTLPPPTPVPVPTAVPPTTPVPTRDPANWREE